MERKSIQEQEESMLTSLLIKEKHGEICDCGNCGNCCKGIDPHSIHPPSSSAATTVVVLSTLVAVCGTYTFGCALGYSSPAESGIVDDLGLSVAQYSMFGSILTFGAMFGAVLSGRISDLFGRRCAMWFSQIFCILGWIAIAFAKGVWWLDIGRLLVGFGIGILSYVVPVYIAEITPMILRGGFTSFSQLMVTCGVALSFLIGSAVTWRILALIGTIPSLLQLIGLFFIPESPRWLENIGRGGECEAALRRLRGKNTNISQEAAEIKNFTENTQRLSETGIVDLFQWKYALSIIVGVGLMVLQQFGGIDGFTFYTSSIFEAAGFPSKIGIIAAGIIQIVMSVLGVLLLDIFGRRPLLLVAAAGSCLGSFLTGLSFFLQDLNWCKDFTPILVLIGVLVFLGSFAIGMGGIPWVIMSEIFPINIKGSAGSLVTFVSWFGSWVVSYSFSYLFEWSSGGTFFIFSSVSGIGILFVAKLVPETKGRTLEEIQSSVNRFMQ